MKQWFPWIAGLLILGGIVWSFFYLKDMHPMGSLGSKLDDDSMENLAIRFNNAKLVGRSGGEKVWEFEADTIDLSKDRRNATFHDISKGILFKDNEKVASIATSKVVYNTISKDVFSPETADLEIEGGPKFKVSKVYWNEKDSTLTCEGGVEAEFEGSALKGERMIANLEEKEVTIHKVEGSIMLED